MVKALFSVVKLSRFDGKVSAFNAKQPLNADAKVVILVSEGIVIDCKLAQATKVEFQVVVPGDETGNITTLKLEQKEETVDEKKHDGYKGKRKKFFNKNRFKDNKRPKKKEATPNKEVS